MHEGRLTSLDAKLDDEKFVNNHHHASVPASSWQVSHILSITTHILIGLRAQSVVAVQTNITVELPDDYSAALSASWSNFEIDLIHVKIVYATFRKPQSRSAILLLSS